MGINLGAMFSPIVCGTLGQVYGWHYGFAAAGVGMMIGLAVYHFGRKYLPLDKHEERKEKSLPSESKGNGYAIKIIMAFLAAGATFFAILVIPAYLKVLVLAAAAAAIYLAVKKLPPEDKSRVGALILVCISAIIFWAIYEQQGNTLQLWADEKTDWTFFGMQIPSTMYQFFNPAMIFIFAPFLDMFWNARAKMGKKSTSIRKMGVGSILTGLAFIVMILAAKATGEGLEKGSVLWLVITTWIFTMGELYFSPIGLSFYNKVAPASMASMMMGVWLFSSFIGNYLAGYVGSFYTRMPKDNFFLLLCCMGVAVGLLFFLAEGKLKKLVGDV